MLKISNVLRSKIGGNRPGIMVLLLTFMLLSFMNDNSKITVWLVGDSTMSVKQKTAYPETGWGMPFASFFDSNITVNNVAQNGRSTKSFIEEKRWQQVMDNLQAGDYVLIQFGHNDEVTTKKTYTTPEEFSNNLDRFVKDVRSKKATPVLITPVARRKFDSSENIIDTHRQYAQLVRDAARQNGVILIDLDALSMELLRQTGPENSKFFFNYLKPGEHPNYPNGQEDDTHFNELGARKMAEIVLHEIQQLPLAKFIIQKR
ncbi:rhamnogalacturonan acetylesterase [Parafilimonas sp.]|uniref:rhamnogalacturonan acetylesterase n=1 Tax=Parafilimonas sp. TaxID=1969739 RepID=UPI0039E6EF09